MTNSKSENLLNIVNDKTKTHSFVIKEIKPQLREMENIRKKHLKLYWSIFFPVSVAGIIMFFVAIMLNNAFSPFLFFIGLICTASILFPSQLYKKSVKEKLMHKIVEFFDGINYKHGKGISEQLINESGLMGYYNRIEHDECFYGVYEGVKLKISETCLRYKSSRKKSSNRTVFRGILILLEMNKKFSGKTVVLKNTNVIGEFFTKTFKNLETVRLEDPEFEKIFDVYSTDQIEARCLLTVSFMERLLAISRQYGNSGIQASFFDNDLLIAIPCNKDMFEFTSLFKSTIALSQLKQICNAIEEIAEVLGIIKILKLNQRIGL